MKLKKFLAKVVGIKQTKGPTVFFLYNLKETIKAAAFAGKGERAYPEIKEGSIVKVELEKCENGKYTIKNMEIAEKKDREKFVNEEKEKISDVLEASKCYLELNEKMLFEFEKFRDILKEFVLNDGGKIYIKHHKDIDGYFSAILMNEILDNILKKIKKSKEKLTFPLKNPFYDISNALFDKNYLEDKDLIIILDNGGCKEDILPIKILKENKTKIVVIDHHSFLNDWEKRRNEHPADVLILPSEEFRDLCTTALVFEIGYYLNLLNEKHLEFVKIAVLADKCGENVEKMYHICDKEKENLEKKRWRCDFVIFYSNSNTYSFLKEIVEKNSFDILDKEIENIKNKKIKEIEETFKILEKEHEVIYLINLNILSRDYPPDGRKTGIFFEKVKNKKEKVGVISFRDDLIIVRISDNFERLKKQKVEEIIKDKDFDGLITIGGHENAYSIKFPPFLKEKLIDLLRGSHGSNSD